MPDLRRSMLRLMCVLFVASVTSAVTAQTAKPTGPTVWDGVFTDAQADRAAGTFSQSCERCHTLSAQGTRPLSGDKFWEGLHPENRRRPPDLREDQHAERSGWLAARDHL